MNTFDILISILTAFSLLLSILSFRDRQSKDMEIKLNEVAKRVEIRIERLEMAEASCDKKHGILEERLFNVCNLIVKLEAKIDIIIEELKHK
jgi:hypothetical protein